MNEAGRLITMAKYLARQAVKQHLQDRGIKPLTVEHSEINRAMDAYLLARKAELIAEAKRILTRS
jgi:hypothetical protein